MPPDQIKAAIEALKNNDAAAALAILEACIIAAATGEEMPGGETPPIEAAGDAPDEPKPDPMMGELCRLTGVATGTEAIASVTALLNRVKGLDTEAAALEGAQRNEIVAEFVKLGVEYPATAWEDPNAKPLKPCKRLASEPIADLKSRLATVRAAKGIAPPPPKAPASGEKTVRKLSAAAQAHCKKVGITPEEFLARADNAARRHGASQ